MRYAVLLLCVFASVASATNPPSILHSSVHEAYIISGDLNALGITAGTGTANYTNSGPATPTQFAVSQAVCGQTAIGPTGLTFVNAALALSTTYPIDQSCPTPSLTPTAVAPILGESTTAYSLQFEEQAAYSALISNGMIYAIDSCGSLASFPYPPVAFTTMLPHGAAAAPSGGCGYNGNIEFSIPVTPGDTSCGEPQCWTPINDVTGSMPNFSPSDSTEAMEAVLASIKIANPTWNWQDIKSVLRSTASNWSTGYAINNSGALGYGDIAWSTAKSYSGTIYLQPPGLHIDSYTKYAKLTVYPFTTTRRQQEVIVAFSSAPTWLAFSNNEYTYAQFSSLLSSYGGAVVLYSGNVAGPYAVEYQPTLSSVTLYFAVFTVDSLTTGGSEHYSRGEVYVAQGPFTLNESYSCLRP